MQDGEGPGTHPPVHEAAATMPAAQAPPRHRAPAPLPPETFQQETSPQEAFRPEMPPERPAWENRPEQAERLDLPEADSVRPAPEPQPEAAQEAPSAPQPTVSRSAALPPEVPFPSPSADVPADFPSPSAEAQDGPAASEVPAAPAAPPGPVAASAAPAASQIPPETAAAAATATAAPIVPDREASPDAILIRRTLGEIAPFADQVTAYFYALLFVRHPELRGLFPAAMDTQRDRLLKALLTAAEHMDDPAVLTDYLRHLGRGHRKYGAQSTHYPAVGEALIGALTRYALTTWSDETEDAWVRTYTTISQIMIDAAAENERHAPAWWNAEVVSHEMRTSDIAVITVRPDQPYPFLAGQYTSLETPWWPRVWRHYSFASAPRADGLLAFHVKAVPVGWVSNALVHHARPGDVLRLGPPAGSMTVDHSTDSGLLCLGGGTGIAPIKALIEDVAKHGHRRPVEVFYGARHDHDLYDIETMLQLESAHPWLAVRPVIAEGSGQGYGPKGPLPEAVVRDYGPWHEFDAYLSGPPGMVRSGISALQGAGIPFDRIRHDSLDALVAGPDGA
ncbi:globin domain-containing protein [Streptomyces sp. NPDC088725]|uniref:globin domain-containing protein n=1 Tax=Streptomyces sp. NPDC088725 TaxID=3365873 RepID=UPI00380AD9D1